MSVMQATSFAFQTSCAWCNAVRQTVAKPFVVLFQGIILGRQLKANYHIAEKLAGQGDYRGMTVSEVANLINQQTI